MLTRADNAEQYKALNDFVFQTNERLSNSLKSSLFTGKLRVFNFGKQCLLFVELNVLFPPFFLYSLFGLLVLTFLIGFGWWSVVLALISSLGLLWTKFPYFLILSKGLKKNGFDGRLKLL